ncbi:MAG: 2Fe-2S iron-sulfur cluster-binding protein [Roseibium sp.]
MVQINFVHPDGRKSTVEANAGTSVMEAAVANGVEGIFAECGGSMMCATCHCYVDDAWLEKTGSPIDGEEDMLECAAGELRKTSRLSCQIKISDELDGLTVHLPEEQG